MEERLRKIEETLTRMDARDDLAFAHQQEFNARILKLGEDLEQIIYGNGGQPGVLTRIDRLERRNLIINWLAGTTLGGVIVASARMMFGAG